MSPSPPPVSQAEGAVQPPGGALSSELPQRRSWSRSPSARASWAREVPLVATQPGPGTAAPLLRTGDPSARPRPDPPLARGSPLPALAQPPGLLAAAAAAASPFPARAPHPGEAAADPERLGQGETGEVRGAGDGEREVKWNGAAGRGWVHVSVHPLGKCVCFSVFATI